MAELDPIDRLERAISGLSGVVSLVGTIYRTGQDLHCVDTDGLACILGLLHRELQEAASDLPH